MNFLWFFASPQEAKWNLPLSLKEKRSDLLSESGWYPSIIGSILNDDAILSDAFVRKDGRLNVNVTSAILEGHFPGMPVMPGVVVKRLVRTSLGADLYHHWTDRGNHVWKTEFLAPILPGSEGLKLSSDGGKALALSNADGKEFARFTVGEAHLDDEEKGVDSFDLRARHFRDVLHSQVDSILPETDDARRILQSGAFRFVTAANSMESEPGVLGGSWEVPEYCPFLETNRIVSIEIIEESVAQIFSLAYSKSRNLEPLIGPTGMPEDRAKVFVFKSSVSEAGDGVLFPSDRLSVAMRVEEETDRAVRISYEAWNVVGKYVLRGIIEATPISMKLFKRMAKAQ